MSVEMVNQQGVVWLLWECRADRLKCLTDLTLLLSGRNTNEGGDEACKTKSTSQENI